MCQFCVTIVWASNVLEGLKHVIGWFLICNLLEWEWLDTKSYCKVMWWLWFYVYSFKVIESDGKYGERAQDFWSGKHAVDWHWMECLLRLSNWYLSMIHYQHWKPFLHLMRIFCTLWHVISIIVRKWPSLISDNDDHGLLPLSWLWIRYLCDRSHQAFIRQPKRRHDPINFHELEESHWHTVKFERRIEHWVDILV